MSSNPNGKLIPCYYCGGTGMIVGQWGDPEECNTCESIGTLWRYNGGAIAQYYSGPFIGKETRTP